ncbi:hypothetical protein AB0M57_04485 [Streptomyces sp. NPDC051597]|uniref:hypothetical protein n=1 Tax=Streptomyces sp. NPDC051597 TaxID=3155049 RepID=UPI00342D55C2
MTRDLPLSPRNRRGRPVMTPEQQALAEDLHVRALALRAASDGELSIREAVDLAAVQLGREAPQNITEGEFES